MKKFYLLLTLLLVAFVSRATVASWEFSESKLLSGTTDWEFSKTLTFYNYNNDKKGVQIGSKSAAAGEFTMTSKAEYTNVSSVSIKAATSGSATVSVSVNGKAFTVKLSGIKVGTKLDLVIEKEGYITLNKTLTAKGTLKLSKVKAKKNAKKITGTVSQKKATVKVKVGKKKYKKAKVSGKKFTFKCAKVKKGTTVKIQVTKKNYKTLTKSYKVK